MSSIKHLSWKISLLLVGLLFWGLNPYTEPIDFTQDQRYTLAPATLNLLESVEQPLQIDVFLSGPIPQDYQRLRRETQLFLSRLQKRSNWIEVNFINPFEEVEDPKAVVQMMGRYGLAPENVFEQDATGMIQQFVFPWAIINTGEKSVRVKITEQQLGQSPAEKIQRAIENLEYLFMDGIDQLLGDKNKSIGVLRSHGCSSNLKLYDFLSTLGKYYNIAPIDLRKAKSAYDELREVLSQIDLLLISNPVEEFEPLEQFVLDQHLINGGHALWLVDPIRINRDSLFNQRGKALAYKQDLNLDELLFKYGLRLSSNLVQDLFSAPIVLAQGANNASQYIPFPWPYYPLPSPEQNKIFGISSGPVWLRFPGTLDTLKNSLHKTILLRTSNSSRSLPTPMVVQLKEVETKIDPTAYSETELPLGVLLEGIFDSAFKNRILPEPAQSVVESGTSKLIFISDGSLAENQIDKGSPLPLGFDKWTRNSYENLSFLTQITHFLMGKNDRLSMKNKTYKVSYLDPNKVARQGWNWKITVIFGPLIWFGAIYMSIQFWRKRQINRT